MAGRSGRAEQTEAYLDLFDKVAELLFRHDPVGINFESNTDEYEPEVRTILPRLPHAASVADVRTIVGDEFDRWFHVGAASSASLDAVASEVWELWMSSPLRLPVQ